MPLSTRTIQDSINWAKRFNFNRNPVIGNSLEPALTSASLVMQAILGPPMEWWWNNEDLVFTCNPAAANATSTVISIVGGLLTVTATNSFAAGNSLIPSGIAGSSTALNGVLIEVVSANSTTFTANVNLPDSSDTTGLFTNITTQDYTIPAASFSHVKNASVLDLDDNGVPTKWYQLEVKNDLALETSQNRPIFLSPQAEDANGNVTFRVFSAPDKPYPINVNVQRAAPAITSINQTWAPLPDYLQSVYEWGFLALMLQFSDDPARAAYANNQFKASLLGYQEGLSEEQKQIFLNNWQALQEGYLMKMQQGIAARGQ